VRYTKYKKEYNRAEFTDDHFINKKLQRNEGGNEEEKIVVEVKGPSSARVFKNQRGFEMRQRERQDRSKRSQIICLSCRKTGHKMSACPQQRGNQSGSRICYKCGANDHSIWHCPSRSQGETGEEELPFAKCFVCGESGHLSGGCSKNEHGKYPKGGACKVCGDKRHFGKDCPLKKRDRGDEGENLFSDEDTAPREKESKTKKSKPVKVVEFK
jgi:zinc finger CCHC domain-containing protein 9